MINTVYCHVQCPLRYLHLRKSGLRSIYSIILLVRVRLSVEKKAITAISELFIAMSDRNISDIDFSSRRAGSEFELDVQKCVKIAKCKLSDREPLRDRSCVRELSATFPPLSPSPLKVITSVLNAFSSRHC